MTLVLIKSNFRKLFCIRLAIGIFLFLILLVFSLNTIFNDFDKSKILILFLALTLLSFLIYVSFDLFNLFSLVITENGIEKTSIITRRKQIIPFKIISNIQQQKVRYRNTRGVNISDGHSISILKFENGKSLIISPDNFENYQEIMSAINGKLELSTFANNG